MLDMRTPPPENHRLYTDLAWPWPVISPRESYIEEAEGFREAVQMLGRRPVKSLLHLGCGGGHLDFTLKKNFKITGVDLSEGMLSLARRLNPEVRYLPGDMRTIRLAEQFDAAIIADSINYMLSDEDLKSAFKTAYEHLRPGGIFCTYAETTRENFKQNKTECTLHEGNGIEVTFIENAYDPDIADSNYEYTFIYLIRERGKMRIETDRHRMGIFDLETWQNMLKATGFQVAEVDILEDRPLFACLKPDS